MLKLHRTSLGLIVEQAGIHVLLPHGLSVDDLLQQSDLLGFLSGLFHEGAQPVKRSEWGESLAPIDSQEVWAAGVTYLRSREARRDEAQASGGGAGVFYDRVYEAPRPELFFKATPHRVAGPSKPVRIRSDSRWNVPEPELALAVNRFGRIVGYTIGNDMSSRDIEGENPLYLPQAKVYDGCCALGPCVLVTDEPLSRSTEIALQILRDGTEAFSGKTSLSQMRRGLQELVDYLFRDNSFPCGCYLLTGTGVVPPDSFTLRTGDEVRITIEPIGTLSNTVA